MQKCTIWALFSLYWFSSINYYPLWKMMKAKGVSPYKQVKMGIDDSTLDSLKFIGNINLKIIDKICKKFFCIIDKTAGYDKHIHVGGSFD